MTYTQSIRRVNIADAVYRRLCEQTTTDSELAEALERLHKAKAEHREAFGTLRRIDGSWE